MDDLNVIFRSWQELIVTCLALGLSQFVYVMFGFGAGLIAVGALAAVLPNLQDVVVLVVIVCLPSELFVVIKSWKEIRWKGVALILVGVTAGVPLGTWLLHLGDPTIVLAALGIMLLGAGTGFLFLKQRKPMKFPRWTGGPVGLVSGALSGLFGTGGPPLVFYYQLIGIEKAAFRAHLMAVFLAVTVVRMPAYTYAGLFTEARLWSALMISPVVLLGAYLGHRLQLEVSEATFRRMVSVALVIIGAVLLYRCFSGVW